MKVPKKKSLDYNEFVDFLLSIYKESKHKEYISIEVLVVGNLQFLKKTYSCCDGMIDPSLVDDIKIDLRERINSLTKNI
jgi:hypothetical protein